MRFPCQVCGRYLKPLKDGTARRHGRGMDCPGSGYRLKPWEDGQLLQHYAGSLWQVLWSKPSPSERFDWMVMYVMVLHSDPHKTCGVSEGESDSFHGEYLHRHGWQPPEPQDA